MLEKDRRSMVQVPGCYYENKNGIHLPHRISNPIKENDISDDWVHGWESALENIRERIRQSVEVTEQQSTENMTKQDILAEAGTLQDNVSYYDESWSSYEDSKPDKETE